MHHAYVSFAVLLAVCAGKVSGDQLIYSDNALEGECIFVNATENSSFWLENPKPFGNATGGIRFDIAGNHPDLSLQIGSTIDWAASQRIKLSDLVSLQSLSPNEFTTVFLDFSTIQIPYSPSYPTLPDSWNIVLFMAFTEGGAEYYLDNIVLVE
ncbi:unnamed protein product [Somion occarium]|uniref:Uncharacterized protein n=1 Tax=Somion occarium TaxID=3059160 RepID=A0ABP1CUC0_9APHY